MNRPFPPAGRMAARRRLLAVAALAALAAVGTAAVSAAPGAPRYRAEAGHGHKVKVTDGASAAALTEGGARLIADYGTFQYFEANDAALQELAARGVESRDTDNRIELHAGVIDTTSTTTRTARARSAAFNGHRLHLVQFAAPVKPEWFERLAKTGAQIVDYIPNNAYLVYGDASAIAAVQNLAHTEPAVQFEGAFLDRDRISPRVGLVCRNAAAAAGSYYAIQLVEDPEANPDTLAVIDALKLEPIKSRYSILQFLNVIVKLPADAIDGLATQPDVVSITPYEIPHKRDERQDIIVSGQLAGNQPTAPGYLDWLASKGFTQAQFDASGFAVDVSDSGIDNGTQTPNHFALYKGGNTASTSRVVYNRIEGSPNGGSTIQGCDGHGNLNSHIIGGYVSLTNFPHTDSAGYRYGLGVCPFVKVGSSVIFDPDTWTSPNYPNLMSRAYRDGARISSDSWGDTGASAQGAYNSDSQAYDALVRDAAPAGSAVASNGNQQMIIVFAAGNAGSGAGTVEAPGTGKNVIAVGAAENVHSHAITNGGNSASGNDGCSEPDTGANSANDIISFSGRGPCDDSRIKPDIMAPGTHITGGVGQNVRTMQGTGTALSCFDATGVCALPGGGSVGSTNNFFPLGQQFYSTSSGTSHSTPAVAGGCALLYQWFLNRFGTSPSPAMVKAWLINAARYMTGTSANDTLPSNNQGMGMMDLGMAFDGVTRLVRDQLTNDLFTASGQSRTFTGHTVTNTAPLRIALAWTDAPGSTSGNAYKNDLDLTVVVNGQTYHGNVFSGASSITGGSADPRNNTECVFLPAGTAGSVEITVSAANINSDGVPNFGGALDQDFALVAYNFELPTAPYIVAAGSPQLVTETCGAGNGAVDPGEQVTMRFALQNIGTGNTTNLVATLAATGGVTSPIGAQSYGALVAGGAAVTNAFTFTASGTCGGTITATLSLLDGTTDLGSVASEIKLGTAILSTKTNTNTSKISIPNSGKASPYPSTINVTGMTGTVTAVSVSLVNLTHTYPDDIDVLLVGPGGESVVLMSDAGGGGNVNNITLTFDDSAASSLPDSSTLTTGTYKPTDYETGDTFASPAPGGPYGSALSVFNGTSPTGTWSLYVVDDASPDKGAVNNGWRLTITAGLATCCVTEASADLALSKTDGPDPLSVGSNITYVLSVTNRGPDAASSVTVTDALPAGVSFVSAVSSQGACTNQGGIVTCSVGGLASNAVATVTIVATANSAGTITNRASVSAATSDLVTGNNAATATTVVLSLPQLLVSPAALSFGVVEVGQSSTQNFSVVNTGQQQLTGTAAVGGPYSVTNGGAYTVAAGQTGTLAVVFGPLAEGPASNNIVFTSNGGGSTNPATGFGAVAPSAAFGASSTSGVAPLIVTFTNLSSGTITNSSWDFGDGGTTNAADPVHAFTTAGTFSVRLTVSGPLGSDTNTQAGLIAVVPPAPIAAFSGAPTSGLVPLLVQFTNLTGGVSTNFVWHFGDGANANATDPSHLYATAGVFEVSLAAEGPGGATTNSKVAYIVVTNLPPHLEVTPPSHDFGVVETGTIVQFNFAVTNSGGESLTGTAAVGGPFALVDSNFTVDAFGATNLVVAFSPQAEGPASNDVIVISNGGDYTNVVLGFGAINPSADFSGSPLTGLVPLVVSFTNLSAGTITNFTWTFGDGATSNAINPTHVYPTSAVFGVDLVAEGPLGASTNAKVAYIVVTNLPPHLEVTPPSHDFGVVETGTIVQFDFAVTNSGGESLTGIAVVGGPFILPSGSNIEVAAFGATNLLVAFAPSADGAYSNEVLVLSNGGSTTNPVLGFGASVPMAEFYGTPTTGLVPLAVSFTNLSAGTITNFTWTFGDGSTSNAINPTHVYPTSAVFGVDLVAEGPLGASTNAKPSYIVVTNILPYVDLSVTVTGAPNPVVVGSNLFYSIAVTNAGPFVASNVVVISTLPPTVAYVSSTPSQGSSTGSGGIVTCDLGDMSGGATAAITITVTADAAGSLTNIVTVTTDTHDVVPSNDVDAAIVLADGLPRITPIPDQTIDEDASTTGLTFIVEDDETAPGSLSVTATASDTNLVDEAGLALGGGGTNRTLVVTPLPDANGTTVVSVVVSDGLSTTSTAFTLTVLPVNDAPVLTVPTNQTVDEETALAVTSTAADVDLPAQALSFSLLNAPTGALIGVTDGVFTWTPDEVQGPAPYSITVVVTDDGTPPLSSTGSFTVVVQEVNLQPTLAAVSNRTLIGGAPLIITNAAVDADLPTNTLTYSLVLGPTDAVLDAASGVLSWIPHLAEAYGTNHLMVRVTDDGAPPLFDDATFEVIVLPPAVSIGPAGPFLQFGWPHAAGAFLLEATTNLPYVGPWQAVTDGVAVIGGENVVTSSPAESLEYFRLRLP